MKRYLRGMINDLLRKHGVRAPRALPIIIEPHPTRLAPGFYIVEMDYVPERFRDAVEETFLDLEELFGVTAISDSAGSYWSIAIPVSKLKSYMRGGK
jgi:hypothetical protein